ncbi:MAG TPA: hypothetical protein VK533_05460 [Sphingomonas sp.]|uniref:GFA family protein n=1 Tax=Sphingomonas sp. TaxID=28214 RepID=UPI002C63F404|nr:hypothetical protein [Sphingomonas sp.]HMI18973.1 hypothetical protein [Sphingomonas sp.]
MRERISAKASCQCGRVEAVIAGKPILHAICYCESCRTAGLAFAQAPNAPSIVARDGGTDFLVYRKDRVGRFTGGDLLREHRLKPDSPTRRIVATCCNTPMFLDFTKGHWLSLYAGRLSGNIRPLDMRVMTADRPEGPPLPDDVSNHATHSPRFLIRLLVAWAAMGFRKPKIVW